MKGHTVVVIDDDHSVRQSLERLLNGHGYSTRTYADPADFLREDGDDAAACLLLDQHLIGVKGIEVMDELRRLGRLVPTVFLSADWDAHSIVHAIRSGAEDYVTKPFDPDELLAVIQRACQHADQHRLEQSCTDELLQRAARLTARERAIVSLVVEGLLNKQIADRLNIALVTVKVHRGRAMRKLGAQNAAELARIAVQVGL